MIQLELYSIPERVMIALKCLERYYNSGWIETWCYWTPSMKSYNLLCKCKGVINHDRVLNDDIKFKQESFRYG